MMEQTYFLSKLLQQDNACLRCMNNKCNIHEKKVSYPLQICGLIKNPTKIDGVSELFTKAKLDFNGKKPFYTICNYINGNCKNCKQQRKKKVLFNNDSQFFYVCYPDLDNSNETVTVGVHFDIKLVISENKKYKATFLPYYLDLSELKYEESIPEKEDIHSKKELDKDIAESMEKNKIELLSILRKKSIEKKENENKPPHYVKKIHDFLDNDEKNEENQQNDQNQENEKNKYEKDKQIIELKNNKLSLDVENLDWPSMGKPSSNSVIAKSPTTMVDYSRLRESLSKEKDLNIDVQTTKNTIDVNISEQKTNIQLHLSRDTRKINCSYNVPKDALERQNCITDEYNSLCKNCNKLSNIIDKLKNELYCVKIELDNCRISFQNSLKTKPIKDEIEENTKIINTRVAEQFRLTSYSEYDFTC